MAFPPRPHAWPMQSALWATAVWVPHFRCTHVDQPRSLEMGSRGSKNRSHCFRKACSPSTHQPWMRHQDVSLHVPYSGGNGSPSLAAHHEHLQNVTASLKLQLPGAGLCPSSTFHHEVTTTSSQRESLGFGALIQPLGSRQGSVKGVGSAPWANTVRVPAGPARPEAGHQWQVSRDGGSPAFQNHRPGHASQTAGLYLPPGWSGKEPFCSQRAPQ